MIRLLSRLWGWLSEPVDPQTSDQRREFVSAPDDKRKVASSTSGEVGAEGEQTTELNTTFTRRISRGQGLDAARKPTERDDHDR